MDITIECLKRPEGSKPNALRRSGLIPGNLYGHKGTESISVTIDAKVVERLLKKGAVNNTLIDLKITDIPWQGKTLLREVQVNPAKGNPYHLSFFAVAGHGPTTVEVPLRFVGEAAGVKLEGGLLDTVFNQLQVSCDPENIPEAIEVDVSNLKVGDSLLIHELILPPGVTVLNDADQIAVSILPPQITPEKEAELDAANAGGDSTTEPAPATEAS